MKDAIVLVGAGGHAKVCIELLRAMGKRVDYCIGGTTDNPKECMGIPIVTGDENLAHLYETGYSKIFIAIGSNPLRQKLANQALKLGYQLVNAISPHAVISPTARLGKGIAIMAGVVINAKTAIDDLAIINTGTIVDHDCKIGKAAHIAPQCGLAGNVSVGERSFLGIGSKIIPEVSIGNDVIIGAGGVVTSDIADKITAVGVPARPIGNKTTCSGENL
jgi:UDP-perosamine 4-acetyltransferase